MIAAYIYAVEKYEIRSITHKFLVRGHTQNEGDAIHSIIEKKISRSKRAGPIYVPDQYVSLIRDAKKKGHKIEVQELGYEDFYDLKRLLQDMKLNFNSSSSKDNFKINDIKVLELQKGRDLMRYKTSYEQREWLSKNFGVKTRRSKLINIKNLSLHNAYDHPLPISENKKKDLKSLVQSKLIPSFYANFYNALLTEDSPS